MSMFLLSLTLSVGFGLLGISLILPAWARRKQARTFNNWREEHARIESAALREQPHPGEASAPDVDVYVQFEYYSGGQMRFGGSKAGTFPVDQRAVARECAASFVPGAPITVFCDPEDDHHILLQKPKILWRRNFWVGIIIVMASVLLFFVTLFRG
jgi:hypothetical protein